VIDASEQQVEEALPARFCWRNARGRFIETVRAEGGSSIGGYGVLISVGEDGSGSRWMHLPANRARALAHAILALTQGY
jgi:hypothetical protein